MSKAEVIEKVPLTLAEVKNQINTIEKRDNELNFRAGKTKDYLNSFKLGSKKAATELKQKISELDVPRLKEEYIVKIVDMMPKNVDELNIILQGYTLTVTKENMKKIVEVVNS